MKIETTFLRSKVAIRIFVLFVFCALVPIIILAILSYNQVTQQLNEQTQKRLKQAAKDVGLAIGDRLFFLESGLKETAFDKSSMGSNLTLRTPAKGLSELLKKRFESLTIVADQEENILLFGNMRGMPKLTPEQKQHIRSGGTYVWSNHFPDLRGRVFMSVAIDPKSPTRGILLGEISPAYLWGPSSELPIPPMMELCILDEWNNVLFSSSPEPVSLPEEVKIQMARSALGQFEWVHGEKGYLASYRYVHFQGSLLTPRWTVVLSESKSDALAPASKFKKIFLLTLLMSLWGVLLLSIVQIRRSLIPLEKLREGTRRVAEQDFYSQVTIKSGDEFEELAASFNTMASRLGKQFNALTTMGEIDRAILSAMDTEKIVEVVLTGIPDVLRCDRVSVTLLDSSTLTTGRTYIGNAKGREKTIETVILKPEEIEKLNDHPGSILIEVGEAVPGYLASSALGGIKTSLILPIILKKKLSGFITLGWYLKPTVRIQEDLDRARQLADQMGVALSNASLIKELSELNWGTLEALARAIDAKSPWTAGHSERVTKLALKIGQSLGLIQEEMNTLHRAGLLHDIGKLGIPVDILDKEGKLSKKEERLMREHVRLGVRILEPITAYAEVVPIVLHHHEYFNGEGYPDGLAGKAISLGGRIFAVADSFDALTSDRPYRRALKRAYAIQTIKRGSGSQYDPDIVRAFLEVMAQESREGEA